MIVLDSNVVSETMRPQPDRTVTAWLDRQEPTTLFLTCVTAAELRLGVALLPDGRRRRGFDTAVGQALLLFAGRVLPYDVDCVDEFADRVAAARSQGFQPSTADAQVAAIAATRGFVVASRDVAPFQQLGVGVINPFD